METTEIHQAMCSNSSSPVSQSGTSVASQETSQAILRLVEKHQWDDLIEMIKEDSSVAFSSLSTASVLCRGTQGNLTLHEVCKSQPTAAVVEALLEANPIAARTRGNWGYLPLHYACTSGASHHVVELLIDANPAGTRARDDHEETLPLHLACKWGASEAVLIAIMTTHPEGAIFRDRSGKTPMDYAVKLPSFSIMQQAKKILDLAPIMVSVSKAAQRRASDATDNRIKGIVEAHSMHIQKCELQNQREREESKEMERCLRIQLNDANKRGEICNERLSAVKKWVKSLANSMDTWPNDNYAISADLSVDMIETESETKVG